MEQTPRPARRQNEQIVGIVARVWRSDDGAVSRHKITISARPAHHAYCRAWQNGERKELAPAHMAQQDIAAGRGFFWFDLHGDATPFLLRTIAQREQKLNAI